MPLPLWVNVPTVGVGPSGTAAFALERVKPNPVLDRLMVSFTLPSGAPARLDLLDVAGRRIESRAVGALGAGTHQVDLSDARTVAPGLYVVRLAQGDRVQTTRVIVAAARER